MQASERLSTRFSSIQNGISFISYSNRDHCLLRKYDKQFADVGRLCSVIRHTKLQQFLRSIKRLPTYEYVIVLLDELEYSILKNIMARLEQYRQIRAILIIKSPNMINADEEGKFKLDVDVNEETHKIIETFGEYQSMFVRLEQLLHAAKERFDIHNIFITLNCKQKALRDLRQELGPFLWTHTFRLVLVATPHNSLEAKEQMLKECRKLCRYNRYELYDIKKFEETYRSCDAIRWYTKPCFLFRLINNALRSEDPFALYTFRYFIFDLSAKLASERPVSTDPFQLFRGAKLRRIEIEQLGVGSLVAVNGFFSTSRNRHVAEAFINICPLTGKSPSRHRDDSEQYVLFDIRVDRTISPDCVVADAHTQSYIADEEEMIFDLGTNFVITQIAYDPERILWNIQMTSSSEITQLTKEYNTYISERLKEFDANILFGRILTTNLAEYSHALTFYHFLLRTLPVESDERPNIYFELARTYRFLGKHERSIAYFRATLLLQRRYLPQWKFAYGMTLAALGTVYLELGDAINALRVLEKASICFGDYPLDYNYETIFHANRLSYAYYLQGEHERALTSLIPLLDIYKRKMPLDHPSHAQAWHNIGLVQRALGNGDEALVAFKEALRMRKARLSADHPYIARTHYQMGLLYEQRGEIELAVEHAKAALSVRKLRLSPKHNEFQESIQFVERLLSVRI